MSQCSAASACDGKRRQHVGSEAQFLSARLQAGSRTRRWWKDDPPPDGLLNPTNYIERMVGDSVSLLQTRQRLQALADLGHYKGDIGAPWGPAATEALKSAQAALGVTVDGKWGPETEDAVQVALQAQAPCQSLEDCNSGVAPPVVRDETGSSPHSGPSSDALGPLRIVGLVVSGLAVAGVAAAIAFSFTPRTR